MSDDNGVAMERMRVTLDLYEAGEAIMRQNLRRAHPDESEAEIELRLADWLAERPGAEHGDGEGRPVPWPRRRP